MVGGGGKPNWSLNKSQIAFWRIIPVFIVYDQTVKNKQESLMEFFQCYYLPPEQTSSPIKQVSDD